MKVLSGSYSVHQLSCNSIVPAAVYQEEFFSITQTDEELSIVCDSRIDLDSEKREDEFACLQVLGTLNFDLVGILAGITSCLSSAGVSIFAISTYNTDYILLKASKLEPATKALEEAGYQILRSNPNV